MAVAAQLPFHPIPLALSAFLSIHGLRKRSLSPSGALAAFVVGYGMLSPPLKTFGITLIVFYLTGSRATKYGKKLKSTLESNHDVAGYRNARQVLSNSIPALVAAALWTILFAQSSYSYLAEFSDTVRDAMSLGTIRGMASVADGTWKGDGAWCAVDGTVDKGWSRVFIYAALGQFSTCLGDTLASELGILARSPPRLITTLRTVPPGTNGAVSAWGTFCSALGGAIVGLTAAGALWYEDAACRQGLVVVELLGWGVVGGAMGSMLDSLLGATVQRTRYDATSKKILTDDGPATKTVGGTKDDIKIVAGWDVLSNNQVNFVSSLFMAVFIAWFA